MSLPLSSSTISSALHVGYALALHVCAFALAIGFVALSVGAARGAADDRPGIGMSGYDALSIVGVAAALTIVAALVVRGRKVEP